jgi:hypothetical protein
MRLRNSRRRMLVTPDFGTEESRPQTLPDLTLPAPPANGRVCQQVVKTWQNAR